MIALFFTPSEADPTSGRISQCVEAPEAMIFGLEKPFVAVEEWRPDWDVTHEISAYTVVPRDPDLIAGEALVLALKRLRARRNMLLREVFDPLFTNIIRWSALTAAEQIAVLDWRDALLAWPEVETDPVNRTEPVAPEVLGAV